MAESSPAPLENGIAVIHSNQLEELRDVVEYWLRQHPLAPLEHEVFLVQSNGMGQWLKQALAQNSALGIAASIRMQLPSSFVWQVYRAVLGEHIPREQPLAKAPLIWRLYRLLPTLIAEPGFETLASFLSEDGNCRKRYQLAEQFAELFDQYQVYRSDWLSDWAGGDDRLRNAHDIAQPMPEPQRWQAALWRALLADLGGANEAPFASRASVHAQFMTRIDAVVKRPETLPRRIILFGLSSLPQQSLEVMAKLGKFCQIVLFVHNPCRHYWADLIEDKELLKAERRRQAYKPGMTSSLTVDELHLHAPPLLAAWGKQGRDYIRLLDLFDEKQSYQNWHWPDSKIDLFKDYGSNGQRSLLQHLQQSILDMEPLPDEPVPLDRADDSLVFHVAHSRQREVEILHNQLLARFEAAERDGNPLSPRDVIVMVPDINRYAPHIRAVFGLHLPGDPRCIPYSLADQQQRGHNPLLAAIEVLLDLPELRFTVSQYLGLLEVGALRARFGIDESAIPTLHRWIEEAGIRWGLNAAQRARIVDMPPHLEANTWQFGLRRMLLGYAVGAGEAFGGIEPYEEIGGLEAQWVGSLSFLLETLEKYADRLAHPQNFFDWQRTLQDLLDDFFIAENEKERGTHAALTASLTQWSRYCEQAGLTSADLMPIHVVREAWLSGIDEPSLHRRFLSGRVNFCTLMPMRAIPFRQICLLGMNDGDYPRNQQANSFDLMSLRGQYRPGDRSRRQDDQYLLLEALLSAREQLYISWVGRSIRDNSEHPPSVLISQLRDTLAQGWKFPDGQKLPESVTVEHPLQPFSPAYVAKDRDQRLFTYAREWFAETANTVFKGQTVPFAEEKPLTVTLDFLARFMRAPVKAFCNYALKFGFDDEPKIGKDAEPFHLDRLQAYIFGNHLLDGLKNTSPDDVEAFLVRQQTVLVRKGQLPLGGFAQAVYDSLTDPVRTAWDTYRSLLAEWPAELETHAVGLPHFTLAGGATVQLTGELRFRAKVPLSNEPLPLDQFREKAMVHLTVQPLLPKTGIKYHNLLGYWVQHLAGCAENPRIRTLIIAADGVIEIPPLDPAEARACLQTLLEAIHQGMCEPLPVACKTAFAWLTAAPDSALEKARFRYEGDDWNIGEAAYDAYLARFFPTFADLRRAEHDKDFEFWADTLYRPLFDRIELYRPAPEAQS